MFIRTLVGAGGKAVVVVGWLGNAARWAEVLTERDRQVPCLYISRWTDKLNIRVAFDCISECFHYMYCGLSFCFRLCVCCMVVCSKYRMLCSPSITQRIHTDRVKSTHVLPRPQTPALSHPVS